jgi:cell division protein FtsB
MKSKKLLVILSILLIAMLSYLGYNTFFAPQSIEGSKDVTLQIVIDTQDIEETISYNTEHEFLYDLMREKEEELGASFEDSSLGFMLTGLMNYTVNSDKNEYFHILVNDEDAMNGIQEIPLNDQDYYRFELRKW